MTKKDYRAIAKIIKEDTDPTGKISLGLFLNDLCRILREDSPLFDEEKFRAACQ